jgi:hypothetical protein
MRVVRALTALLLFAVLLPIETFAQEKTALAPTSVNLRQMIRKTKIDAPVIVARRDGAPRGTMSRARPGAGARTAAVAAGIVGGFFLGGYVGAKIEKQYWDCNCDDPGLKGFLIGAPTGAALGGVLAFSLTR